MLMMRILFLILWFIFIFGYRAIADVRYEDQAPGAIEIYANGHKYDSLQAYLAFKKSAEEQSPPTPVKLNSQQEEYMRQEAQQLGMNVDFSKVKSFQINQKKLTDAALHKLYVLSVENQMVGALRDFYQAWPQSDSRLAPGISSKQLQEAIRQKVATSKAPKLLISGPGKVRIMALSEQDSPK